MSDGWLLVQLLVGAANFGLLGWLIARHVLIISDRRLLEIRRDQLELEYAAKHAQFEDDLWRAQTVLQLLECPQVPYDCGGSYLAAGESQTVMFEKRRLNIRSSNATRLEFTAL